MKLEFTVAAELIAKDPDNETYWLKDLYFSFKKSFIENVWSSFSSASTPVTSLLQLRAILNRPCRLEFLSTNLYVF